MVSGSLLWLVVVCGCLLWLVVVSGGGLLWLVLVCGGLWWLVVVSELEVKHVILSGSKFISFLYNKIYIFTMIRKMP